MQRAFLASGRPLCQVLWVCESDEPNLESLAAGKGRRRSADRQP
ncbi:hypothetical protein EJ110_NYTH25262 [Nymphaea thermarum]|nr:hypothetical protein EJ110_NYTH25262 [Nymphaea thermarum]